MMRFRPRLFAGAAGALLLAAVQIGLTGLALGKLGLSPGTAAVLLAGMLFGGVVNLPLFSLKIHFAAQDELLRQLFRLPPEVHCLRVPTRMVVAVNIGGCLLPIALSAYLLLRQPLGARPLLAAVAAVAAIAYFVSFPVPRVGVVMPVLAAPVAAAFAALLLDPQHAPLLAYIAGTFGVLIGADLLHLHEVRRFGGTHAAIGGAGGLDGICLSGVIAALLA